jgi:rod shape-determining protein MreD
MLRSIIAFPLLGIVMILQSAVISRFSILSGHADLMLVVLAAWGLQDGVEIPWHWAVMGGLLVGFVSKAPWPVILTGYLLLTLLAQVLQRRVWQAPILAMFSVTFVGTIVMNFLVFLSLQLLGNPIIFSEALGLVILPSMLLNLLLAIPVYFIIRDLAHWIYPSMEDK